MEKTSLKFVTLRDELLRWGSARWVRRSSVSALRIQGHQPDERPEGSDLTFREFLNRQFELWGFLLMWREDGEETLGFNPENGEIFIRFGPPLKTIGEALDVALRDGIEAKKLPGVVHVTL